MSVNRTVTLSATGTASTGATVTRLDFMVDGAVVGTAMTSPFSVKWDSTTVADGSHSVTVKLTDSAGMTATSAAVMVTVTNKPTFNVTLSAAQIFPAVTSAATGTAQIMANLGSGATSGAVTLTGVTATSVSLLEGFAGAMGTSLITLNHNAVNINEWDVPAGALLTADQITALLQGKTYLLVKSAANPNGELRGQIIPPNITVVWTNLTGAQEVPPVTIAATGVAATTVDSIANTVSVHINSTGVNDATGAELDTGASGMVGTKLVALTKDTVNMGHWWVELAPVMAMDLTNFTGSKWYVNVLTPAFPAGAIRGQIMTTTTTTPPTNNAATFTQVQTMLLTPHCTGCHNGNGTVLPGSMNLTAGNAYAALVGVTSVEQPTMKRVAPNDANNSYIVHKLQGTGITGTIMPPAGGLDPALITLMQGWINAGALNN
jgi:mono/diheme cytochrome c family protein